MSITSIKRYSATNAKQHAKGQYVRIDDIKQYLPKDLEILNPTAEVYTYLLDNKKSKVLALKKEYDADINKITKPRKITMTFNIESREGLEVCWEGDMPNVDIDTYGAIGDIECKLDDIEIEIKEKIQKLIEPYKEKLKQLYSDMNPQILLEKHQLVELAYAIFESNEFDEHHGRLMDLYPKEKTKKKKTNAK